MKKIKALVCVILVISLLTTFGINASAAVSTTKASAPNASYEMVDKKCTFTKIGTDKVTIVNNGSVAVLVYINGIYRKHLNPGYEYTYATYSNQARVQVYAYRRALGTHKIVVKTTSGSISNM